VVLHKARVGPKPDYPGSLVNLGLGAYAGCLAVVVGLSHSFGPWPEIGPVLVALGLHAVLTFVAIAVAGVAYG
jgi:hypothetical protein